MKTITDYSKSVSKIRSILKDYIVENNLKSLVIGVSGGIDSTLICALTYPVAKELGIQLIGRSITIETNKPDEIERAKKVGTYFNTDFKEVDLTLDYQILKRRVETEPILINRVETDKETKIRLGNVKARMRMVYVYDIAQKNKGLVLSTDNFTELMLGFWTLHGADYGMIQELWKTEVYEMTEWIAKNENISKQASDALISTLDAVATDGLGITGSDLDQILPDWKERHTTTRTGYNEVDIILDEYLQNGSHSDSPVVVRHLGTQWKRNWPINIKRDKIV